MTHVKEGLDFSGERFVPGRSGGRIEADHYERYRFARRYVRNRRVLDIACGCGYSAPLLIEAGATQYLGVDIDEESVRYAEEHYRSDRCSFIVASICDFCAPEEFDAITCFETIEHVDCYRAALGNLYSTLRPGGYLLISSPNRVITSPKARNLSDKPENRFHHQEFTPGELVTELVSVGFTVDEGSIFGQRQRPALENKYVRGLMNLANLPDIFAFTSSAEVRPIDNRVARYFVVVARRKDR